MARPSWDQPPLGAEVGWVQRLRPALWPAEHRRDKSPETQGCLLTLDAFFTAPTSVWAVHSTVPDHCPVEAVNQPLISACDKKNKGPFPFLSKGLQTRSHRFRNYLSCVPP